MNELFLLYHELRTVPGKYTYAMECAEFKRHCELFAALHREQPANLLRPEITFDDGHRSNYDLALPILEQQALKAHFFITVGWTGTRAEYMDWEQLRELQAANQIVGAHGWTHTLLTHCTPGQLEHELLDARRHLEDGLGHPVTSMSLPGGRSNRRVLEACWEAGYTEVFTSIPRAEPPVRAARSIVGRLNLRSDVGTDYLERLLNPETRLVRKLEQQEYVKHAARLLLGDRFYAKLWSLVNHEDSQTEVRTGSR